jgi:nicotinate phosphoribosyltransferase
MIAAYEGNTLKATMAFDKYIDPAVNRVALVDFNNDCVTTALEIAHKLGDKLYAVRMDTADNLVDASVIPQMGPFRPNGVCAQLVFNVRQALDNAGFQHVKIMVSGGFNVERITQFETEKVPVDSYAVGASFFNDNINFTADITMVEGKECTKVGRKNSPNPRLDLVKF